MGSLNKPVNGWRCIAPVKKHALAHRRYTFEAYNLTARTDLISCCHRCRCSKNSFGCFGLDLDQNAGPSRLRSLELCEKLFRSKELS